MDYSFLITTFSALLSIINFPFCQCWKHNKRCFFFNARLYNYPLVGYSSLQQQSGNAKGMAMEKV